ncbi:MAG: hydroxymethylglutaryl-CoA lyase [Desulfobacterales bacterium]|jgi:hydroxymethylglutaryl-CoA lyase
MNKNGPRQVTLIEVGPRDGFQFEARPITTDLKVEVVTGLIRAGLTHLQVVSFVHPNRVPQMADAEALLKRLPQGRKIHYHGLVLNARGLARAMATGLRAVEISISASDTHSRRNTNLTFPEALEKGCRMVRTAKKNGLYVRAGAQCALGCAFEGAVAPERVTDILTRFRDLGADAVVVSDTTGMGSPLSLQRLLDRLQPAVAPLPVILHLHDTRGTGLVNMLTGLDYGIAHFDTSLGGMGGCPFIPGAAGNIPTEDAAYLLNTLGIATGIDIRQVAECARKLESAIGRQLPGKMLRVLETASDATGSHHGPPKRDV